MKALVFGEILWDVINGNEYIGGAAFNLAAHMSKMGVVSSLVSSVGKDDLGGRALNKAVEIGLDTRYITVQEGLSTGTVDVTVGKEGHPDYVIHENTAWDNIILDRDRLDKITASGWDVFCFGTLAQRTESNRKQL